MIRPLLEQARALLEGLELTDEQQERLITYLALLHEKPHTAEGVYWFLHLQFDLDPSVAEVNTLIRKMRIKNILFQDSSVKSEILIRSPKDRKLDLARLVDDATDVTSYPFSSSCFSNAPAKVVGGRFPDRSGGPYTAHSGMMPYWYIKMLLDSWKGPGGVGFVCKQDYNGNCAVERTGDWPKDSYRAAQKLPGWPTIID